MYAVHLFGTIKYTQTKLAGAQRESYRSKLRETPNIQFPAQLPRGAKYDKPKQIATSRESCCPLPLYQRKVVKIKRDSLIHLSLKTKSKYNCIPKLRHV